MKTCTPEISWHGKEPIYSVDFQFLEGDIRRLATCGTDRHIRMWEVKVEDGKNVTIEFLSTLTRHTKAVNVVRFSPDGQVLASAGDDSVVMLWRRNDAPAGANLFAEEEEENKETWSVYKVLRSHLEDVYDICWSSDSKYLISGSVDNSAILWDVKKGVRLGLFPDHRSFVQGVAFDPQSEFLATMSSDRCCRVFSIQTKNCLHTISKMSWPNTNSNTVANVASPTEKEKEKPKQTRLFHDDTMRSFFRRLSFSPDGQLLIVPAGCIEQGPGTPDAINTTYIFTRNSMSKPVMYLPGPQKATIAVRCCPVLFDLRKIPKNGQTNRLQGEENEKEDDGEKEKEVELKEYEQYHNLFGLPYRMVFGVATEDSVLLYDTQQPQPFAFITNIHYHQLSDLTWSHDGRILVVASTDGYCTLVTFGNGELGTPFKEQVVHVQTCEEILRKELERQKIKAKKKDKQKESEKPQKEEADKAAVNYSGSAENKTSVNKAPRRVALTTVTSADGNPQRVPLMAVTNKEGSDQVNPGEGETKRKSPRKVLDVNVESSDKPKPRRVAVTTLLSAQKTDPCQDEVSNSSTVDSLSKGSEVSDAMTVEESQLHLELEATCDAVLPGNPKPKCSQPASLKPESCISPLRPTPSSLSHACDSKSLASPSARRRVPLTTLYTPPKPKTNST